MTHYTLVFKHRKGCEVLETHHRFMFTAKILAKYLQTQGFKTIVFLKVNQ